MSYTVVHKKNQINYLEVLKQKHLKIRKYKHLETHRKMSWQCFDTVGVGSICKGMHPVKILHHQREWKLVE